MANEKNITEDALPDNVTGFYDTGNFKIGDMLTEGESLISRKIFHLSSEIFKELVNLNPLKTKQLNKGLQQLTDEGVTQSFIKQAGNKKVIGTVGNLQLDIIRLRLENEYHAQCCFQPLSLHKACWIKAKDEQEMKSFLDKKSAGIAWDKNGWPIFLAESRGILKMVMDHYPQIQLHFLSEKNLESIR
jgi:peptide chain release factor 3